MSAIWQFLRENAVWAGPLLLLIFTGLGWLVKRAFEVPTVRQSQTVSNGSTGIQIGGDVRDQRGDKS
jgi:hypothetical protein